MELEEAKGGGCGVREFVAVKDVSALGGARTSGHQFCLGIWAMWVLGRSH